MNKMYTFSFLASFVHNDMNTLQDVRIGWQLFVEAGTATLL